MRGEGGQGGVTPQLAAALHEIWFLGAPAKDCEFQPLRAVPMSDEAIDAWIAADPFLRGGYSRAHAANLAYLATFGESA